MYCTRCGKKIDYDSFVCNECLAQEEALKNQVQSDVSEPAVEVKEESEFVATVTDASAQEEIKTEPTGTNQQYYYSAPGAAYNYQSQYNAQPSPAPIANPRMIGFGKSLASLILSVVGVIFSFIAFIVAASEEAAAGAVLLIMTLGMAIPALVLGIKSITNSSRVAAQKLPRPIVPLVFGIVGTATAGFALFYCFLTLIMLGAI